MPGFDRIKIRERKFLLYLALAAFLGFATILILVQTGLSRNLDVAISGFFPAFWGSSFDLIALAVTFLGDYFSLVIIILTISYVLIMRGFPVHASALALSMLETGALVLVFKTIIGRARPFYPFYDLQTYAFPSGHSALAVAAALSLAVIIWDLFISRRWKIFSIFLISLFSLAIVFSRIYLNVHWFTDALAGCFLGIFSAALIMSILEGVPERRPLFS